MKRWEDLEQTMKAKAAELAVTREEKLLLVNPTVEAMRSYREALRLAERNWELTESAAGREILDKDQAREHFSREHDFIAHLSIGATLQDERERGMHLPPGWMHPGEYPLWEELNNSLFFEHRRHIGDFDLSYSLRHKAEDTREREWFNSDETGVLTGAAALQAAARLERAADLVDLFATLEHGRTEENRTDLTVETARAEMARAAEFGAGRGVGFSNAELEGMWGSGHAAADLLTEDSYLGSRRAKDYGLRGNRSTFMVPMRDIDGNIHDIQLIDRITGKATFANGHRAPGLMHLIDPDSMLRSSAGGNVGRDQGARIAQNAVFITRSYEEASTIQELTSRPVAVAFSERNMVAVAEAIKGKFPQANVVVLGEDRRDLDNLGRKSEGMRQAAMAAAAADGTVLYPEVTALERVLGVGNWNEIALHRGSSDAQKGLMQQLGVNEPEKDHGKSARWDRQLERQLEKTPFIKRAVQRMRDGIGL